MTENIPTGKKYLALGCAMAVNFLIGSYYTYSSTYDYVAAYLRVHNDWLDEKGTKVKIVLPIWLLVQSCFSVLSVRLAELIGYKTLNFIAFTWFCLNNLAMVFVTDYYLYVAIYGFSNGLAIGFGYLPSLYTAWTYFPEKKSVATGVILFCAGISACICSPIVRIIVNPNNLDNAHPEVIARVPYLFKCLTIAYSTITLIACSLQPAPYESKILKEKRVIRKELKKTKQQDRRATLTDRLRAITVVAGFDHNQIHGENARAVTRELVLRDMGNRLDAEDALVVGQLDADALEDIINMKGELAGTDGMNASIHAEKLVVERQSTEVFYELSKEIQDTSCPSFYYGITSKTFLMMATMAFCCSIYNYYLLQAWKDIFKEYLNLDQNVLSYLLSVGSIANSSFRIIVGLLLLKLSFKLLYTILVTVIVCSAFSFYWVVTSTKSLTAGVFYLFFAFAGLGTMVTIFPTICVKTFGSNVGSKLYPVIYLCFSIASLSAYFISANVSDAQTVFFTFGSLAFIGILVSMFFNPEPSWHKEIEQFEKDQLAAQK
jgi:MFS family permease